MHCAHRLQLAAALAAVCCVQSLAQNNSLVPLKVPTTNVSIQNLTYRTQGTNFRRETQSYQMKALPSSAARLAAAPAELPAIPAPGFYPADMQYGGGAVVTNWKAHPLYVNAFPGTFGDVAGFLSDLGKSKMIHVVDPYVGATGNNRYTVGTQYVALGYPVATPGYPTATSSTVLVQDIINLVYAGASVGGSGYDKIYHLFFAPGVDVCLGQPSAPECYSPDNFNTWYFCAFHGSIDFGGTIGNVLFSVEPYQNVSGCSVPPSSPNGQLKDSTNNVLSHETIEAITDPDGDAWWVQAGVVTAGNEIGDLCIRYSLFPDNNVYWDYGTVRLNGHRYMIQPEYSNQVHGCVYGLLE